MHKTFKMSNQHSLNWSTLQLFCLCCLSICASKSIAPTSQSLTISSSNSSKCDELPLVVLQRVLGPAFDARYMSVNRPLDTDSEDTEIENDDYGKQSKRNTKERPSFYVTEESPRALSNEPAWNMDWEKFGGIRKRSIDEDDGKKRKRSMPSIKLIPQATIDEDLEASISKMEKERADSYKSAWKCETRVKWVDLGPDYHPSHVRTIECSTDVCYYNQFKCRPKQFAVHILRRQRGLCANASNLKTYGFVGDFAEVWEWVEVAISFCCDCVVPKKSFYF